MNFKKILLILMNINKIGNVTAKKIMDSILYEEMNIEKLYEVLQNFPRLKIDNFEVLKKANLKAEKTLERLNNTDINMITYLDKDYPKSFLSISDPPVFLFYIGDIKIASQDCITIVGTRNPSETGRKITCKLALTLCKKNIIVSGLAEGIDTEAHKTTIENNGKTIAILGHGLDTIFPFSNKDLSKEIIAKGGLLISEYPPGYAYSKYTFVTRNRLQNALSNKIYIIETDEYSGTMYTAKKAFEYNKEVFVFKSKFSDYILPSGNKILIDKGAKTFNEDLFF